MRLALLVYSLAEKKLRDALKKIQRNSTRSKKTNQQQNQP